MSLRSVRKWELKVDRHNSPTISSFGNVGYEHGESSQAISIRCSVVPKSTILAAFVHEVQSGNNCQFKT